MTDAAGIPALLDAIRHIEGVGAKHVETTYVHETHEGKTVWRGDIETFDLVKHPTAKRAYAWSETTTGTRRRFFVGRCGATGRTRTHAFSVVACGSRPDVDAKIARIAAAPSADESSSEVRRHIDALKVPVERLLSGEVTAADRCPHCGQRIGDS